MIIFPPLKGAKKKVKTTICAVDYEHLLLHISCVFTCGDWKWIERQNVPGLKKKRHKGGSIIIIIYFYCRLQHYFSSLISDLISHLFFFRAVFFYLNYFQGFTDLWRGRFVKGKMWLEIKLPRTCVVFVSLLCFNQLPKCVP